MSFTTGLGDVFLRGLDKRIDAEYSQPVTVNDPNYRVEAEPGGGSLMAGVTPQGGGGFAGIDNKKLLIGGTLLVGLVVALSVLRR